MSFFDSLPTRQPLFPLLGTILLPKAQLVLNVCEERYLQLIQDAARLHGYVGIVQPRTPSIGEKPKLFKSGATGKIVEIEEVDEDQLTITLAGVCRFDIVEELHVDTPYRQALVKFDRYVQDLESEIPDNIDRNRLFKALRRYFKTLDILPNWDEIEKAPHERLIAALAMVCPFAPGEKQALLELPSLTQQTQMITDLIEMGTLPGQQHTYH